MAAILAFHLSIMNLHTRQKLKRIPLIAIIFSLNYSNREFGEDFFQIEREVLVVNRMFVMETEQLNHPSPHPGLLS